MGSQFPFVALSRNGYEVTNNVFDLRELIDEDLVIKGFKDHITGKIDRAAV